MSRPKRASPCRRPMILPDSRRNSCAAIPPIGAIISAFSGRAESIAANRKACTRRWPDTGACAFPCEPDVPARSAPALWQASVNPAVVILETPLNPSLACWPGLAVWPDVQAALTLADGLHCVLLDRDGPHHIWLRKGAAGSSPACIIPCDESAQRRHLAAWRLDCRLVGRASPRDSAALAPTVFQSQRLTLLLAILDRLASGEGSMREIASELVYPRHDLPRGIGWKDSNERRRTRRLVDEALAMRDGGYRQLLRASAVGEGGQK